MSSLPDAIKESGISIPINKRIWNWLKDNGPHTGLEVSRALNISVSKSSSVLSQMEARKMVSSEKKLFRNEGRPINYYSAVGKVFVLLQLTKNNDVKVASAKIIAIKKSKVEEILDSLSVVDAFEVYNRLKSMFDRKE